MKKKLATLTLDVPYKRAGNVITQQPVVFDVYQDEDIFILVPQLDGPELAVANLPVELRFVIEKGKAVSLRGIRDGNLHVIEDAFERLTQAGVFPVF